MSETIPRQQSESFIYSAIFFKIICNTLGNTLLHGTDIRLKVIHTYNLATERKFKEINIVIIQFTSI